MRAPIYNDRGQFRYSDFVAYIPEYLKSEPDVVTLLQIFSDYINNAYRNIETVEKFEFAIVSRSSEINGAVAKMEYLRTMLELAGARNDYVNLLSVPRANVKSNSVFGQDSGLSPFTVNYNGSEIVDRIDNASAVVPGIKGFSDGDVIFVNYDNIPGEPEHEVAYYYDSSMNCLYRDPDGTSQDPFTGSDNSSARIVSFKASDVSGVKSRYGYTTDNGTQYKEVFFTARIYDVKSENAVKEITLPGGQEGVIDYYGTERTPSGKIRTVVRFDGENGWAWKNGYPTAIIYLTETSGANLVSAKGAGDKRLPLNVCIDPAYQETMNRYAVIGEPKVEDGLLAVNLGSCYPAYANGTVYLAIKRSLQILGEFNVIKDDRESGHLDLRLAPVGKMPELTDVGELVLLDLPLFYGRGTLDYTQASPIIRLGELMELDRKDEGGLNLVPDDSMLSYACETTANKVLGELTILKKEDENRTSADAYMDGGYRIIVPFSSDLAKNFGKTYDLGDRIYISGGHQYWSGTAIVKEFNAEADGYSIKLEGIRAIRPTGDVAQISVADVGYFSTADNVVSGIVNASLLSEEGSVVVLIGAEHKLVARMYPDGHFDREIPDDSYTMEILEKTDDRARILLQVDEGDESIMTVWSRSRGDLFTRKYMMLVDGMGNAQIRPVVFNRGEEVVELVAPGEYKKGQYLYDKVSKKIYYCGEDCIVQDVNSVATSNIFVEDRIVHYSVPYTEKYNAFMPYYGSIAAMEYESRIEYNSDPEVFTAPLYITKVEEKSLKYGWEHREFLNYGDIINLSGRPRNGMVELHTTERSNEGGPLTIDSEMDIVNSDLFERCTWSYPHEVVTKGCSSTMAVDIDDPVVLAAEKDAETGKWNVIVHSAAHGLVDGAMVSVSGIEMGEVKGVEVDFNVDLAPVNVLDGDTFTYPITVDLKVQGNRCFAEKGDGKIVYVQDHYVSVAAISFDAENNLYISFRNKVHGPAVGDLLYLEGCVANDAAFPIGPYVVIEVNKDFTGLTLRGPFDILPVPGEGAIVRKEIKEGDVVAITNSSDEPVSFYEVSPGVWTEVERNALITPLDLYSQTNLFDVTTTNPANALGDAIKIRDIIYTGNGRATVHLAAPLFHFTDENRQYIEGKTVVRIVNVTPSDFNGYHVVEHINSPTSIEISMRLYNNYTNTGTSTGDLDMFLYECRWYKFTIDEIEWEKTSSQATFTGKNRTTRTDGDDGTDADDGHVALMCECEHGLEVGDYVVLGYSFDEFDETSRLSEYAMGKVISVLDKMNVVLDIVYGQYTPGMSIARGVITLPGMDNIVNRVGEYSLRLESIGSEKYRFTDGDIIIAAGQLVPSERLAYLVRDGARWSVLKKKRILKVRRATVDEYHNGYFIDGTEEDGMDEYKYTTYSDVDVAKDANSAYASRMFMVRNPLFNKPSIEAIDTTRNANAEYSSGEDFANIAPRDDMKNSFHGVPDLKYPLIEKIERLAYLRDANVIDFELIGYLARFMGYDLTSMADDVQTSNLYRTVKQQENAIREAVLNLPQYYALGGTNAGLKMLMGAFGVIGDVLTLYTNTMHPYEEMLNKDEVAGRLEEDTTNGTIEGTWVSTPYIDIALTDDSRFHQFAIQPDDIQRIREQIRVWKPIQVVFRDILLRYVGEIELNSWITGPIVGIEEFGTVIGATDGDEDEVLDAEYVDPALTNCAF